MGIDTLETTMQYVLRSNNEMYESVTISLYQHTLYASFPVTSNAYFICHYQSDLEKQILKDVLVLRPPDPSHTPIHRCTDGPTTTPSCTTPPPHCPH